MLKVKIDRPDFVIVNIAIAINVMSNPNEIAVGRIVIYFYHFAIGLLTTGQEKRAKRKVDEKEELVQK